MDSTPDMLTIAAHDADPLIVAVVGDLHVNSTLGLCPPAVRLDDGGSYHPSAFQGKLWACWCDYWQQVEAERGAGASVVVVLNGDLADGDHHNTAQIITRNLETQRQAALETLEPALKLAEAVYVVRGTEAHAGHSAQTEEAVGQSVAAQRTPDGAYSWWALRARFGGVLFDIAHHGPLGRLPWTRPNMLNRLAVETELAYYRVGLEPPAFLIRSHNHAWADSGTNYPVRVLSLAAWQGPTSYVHRLSPGALPEIGGLIFRIERGAVSFRQVSYTKRGAWV